MINRALQSKPTDGSTGEVHARWRPPPAFLKAQCIASCRSSLHKRTDRSITVARKPDGYKLRIWSFTLSSITTTRTSTPRSKPGWRSDPLLPRALHIRPRFRPVSGASQLNQVERWLAIIRTAMGAQLRRSSSRSAHRFSGRNISCYWQFAGCPTD